jgi:hypothetical protein
MSWNGRFKVALCVDNVPICVANSTTVPDPFNLPAEVEHQESRFGSEKQIKT